MLQFDIYIYVGNLKLSATIIPLYLKFPHGFYDICESTIFDFEKIKQLRDREGRCNIIFIKKKSHDSWSTLFQKAAF